MKTLYLLRHAAARDAGADADDSKRSLTKAGKAQARLQALRLRGLEKRIDLILCSPAVRAVQSARPFLREFGLSGKQLVREPGLYKGFSRARFLKVLGKAAGSAEAILVVGHNPNLSELAQALVPSFRKDMAKAALFACRSDGAGFAGLAGGKAEFLFYEEPGPEFEAYLALRAEVEKAASKLFSKNKRRDEPTEAERLEELIEKAAHRFSLKLSVKARRL